MSDDSRYTCRQYREEMILLGLRKRLNVPELSDRERQTIEKEIRRLEAQMGMD
ncbi:MAG: hypothetical protein NWS07_08180 [Desulfobacterales bacterium]|nr:hypothetical protein [Desulfobacterales bacterium]